MTPSSTKPAIVEHVSKAIFDGGVVAPGETSRTATARIAIRATLEYARDNVSDAAGLAGGLKLEAIMFENDVEGTGSVFDDVKPVFRAMIDTLLLEIDQDGGKET